MTETPDTNSTENNCTCCPNGFHIHVDFVKFAEDQLSSYKNSKLGCTIRKSSSSFILRDRSTKTSESESPSELSLNSNKGSKIKHTKRESTFIKQKIISLQTCAKKTNEEIYGLGLLEAVKEFEDFVAKTWGRKRVDGFSNAIPSSTDMLSTNKSPLYPRKVLSSKSVTPLIEKGIHSASQLFKSSSKGVNTECIPHLNIATNTTFPGETPAVARSEQLSKLTIRTQHPMTQTPDFGGEGNISTSISTAIEDVKFNENVEPTFINEEELLTGKDDLKDEVINAKMYPTNEMRAALKTVNDALVHGRTGKDVAASMAIILKEWFQLVGSEGAHVNEIQSYLTTFESYSHQLLRYMVNIPDTSGITALHYAVSFGNYPVVSSLLETKVSDPNKPNKAGYTSVMLASLTEITNIEQEKIIRRLIELSDVNIKAAQHGQTALMLAASHGRFKMVQLLLKAGADVNAQDEDGSTSLMCATEHNHVDITQCLLAQPGCDPNLTDNDGLTALNVAMQADHKDIAVLLYAHMHFVKKESLPGSPASNNSLLLSKRSRSTTNVSSFSNCNDRNGGMKDDLQFAARKQNSSIN